MMVSVDKEKKQGRQEDQEDEVFGFSTCTKRRSKSKWNGKVYFGVSFLLVLVIVTTTFGLLLYCFLKLQAVAEEIAALKREIERIKYSIDAYDMYDENLQAFDGRDMYTNRVFSSPNNWVVFDTNYYPNVKIPEKEGLNQEVMDGLDISESSTRNSKTGSTDFGLVTKAAEEGRTVSFSLENGYKYSDPQNLESANDLPRGDGRGSRTNRRKRKVTRVGWRSSEDVVEEFEPRNIQGEIFSRRRNRHKQSNNIESLDERGNLRLQSIIHFSGDTSKYILGQHANFNGDGHLRHPEQTYADWKPSDWVRPMGMDEKFDLVNGFLKIKENGLYFIYAQVYYLDEHDTNGYCVRKNREIVLQCTVMTHSKEKVIKGNTCYTAGVEYLREGDEVSVRDLAHGRYSLFEPGKSFFGLIKLNDARIR